MPGNSGNKPNKPKLHGSTNSRRDTFNQALNEATTAEQARSEAEVAKGMVESVTKNAPANRFKSEVGVAKNMSEAQINTKLNEIVDYYTKVEGKEPLLPDIIREMPLEDKRYVIDIYNAKIGKINAKRQGTRDPKYDPIRPLLRARTAFLRKKADEYGIKVEDIWDLDSSDWVNQKEKYFKIPDEELSKIVPLHAEDIRKARAEYKPETVKETPKEEKTTSTDDAESLWDVAFKSHDNLISDLENSGASSKKQVNKPETKPETQYAEQAVKEQANKEGSSKDRSIFDVVQDEIKAENPKPAETNVGQPTANPEKVTPEKQAAKQMVENAKAPTEQVKSEKPSEGATADAWFADMLSPDKLAAVDAAAKKQKAIEKQEAQEVQAALERQAAQETVKEPETESATVLGMDSPTDVFTAYNQAMDKAIQTGDYRLFDDFTEAGLWDTFGRANPEKVQKIIDARKVKKNLEEQSNTNQPAANPERQAAKDMVDNSERVEQPINWGKVTGLGYAGLTGLALLAPYLKQVNINEQPQTQVPYRMESEPVNEAVVQPEPTLEQQFVLQSTSPFDYAKIANLFDLYARYGSPVSSNNSVNDEEPVSEETTESSQESELLSGDKPLTEQELAAQMMGQRIATGTGYAPELKEDNFEFPQNSPKVGSNIKTAGLKSPDGGEVPQELNRLSGVKPRVVKDTSKGHVTLNDPNHRKTRDVQNNSVTPEQAVAKQMVSQYAGIPAEVRAKNQPFLTTDAIWNRLRQKGLVSPEEGIRSGLFTPDEVRYITENDLWRYR